MKKLRKTFALLLAMSLVYVGGVFFSCSSDSGDDDSPAANPNSPVTEGSGPKPGESTSEKTITSLELVKDESVKTEYSVGDELDVSGLSVKVTYSDNTSETVAVTKEMVTGFDSSQSTDELVLTIKYDGKDVANGTLTISIAENAVPGDVTVVSSQLEKSESVKTEYNIGDELDVTGLSVKVTYSDNSSKTVAVTKEMVTGFDSSAAAQSQELTVTYDGKEVGKYTISIAEAAAPVEQETVYNLTGDSATINLGKKNIADKAYLVPSESLTYNTSVATFNDVEDNYPNLSGNSRTLDIMVKNVAAFTVYVKSSSARTFLVKIGDNEEITVNHPGRQTINGTDTDVIPFTFNTGSTSEIKIQLIGGNASTYPGYIILYSAVQAIPATKVEITGAPEAALVLADYPSGTTYNNLTATVSPAWHTSGDVIWSSSDETVATIDSTGKIQPLSAGKTTITASAGDEKDEFELNVAAANIAVTGVALDKTALSLDRWTEAALTATVSPEDATDKSVAWTSSNESVVKVVDGKIKALAAGEATVTVKTADGAKEATAAITVKPVYVGAGRYNLSTNAVEGFTVDGVAGEKWTVFGSTDGSGFQVHDGIFVTAKIDSNGANLYSDEKKGTMTFVLTSTMKVTFAGKGSNFVKVGKIKTTNGEIIQVSSKETDNATVADGGLSATIGDTTSKSAVLYLNAGEYTVLGNEGSAFKLQTITFEEAKLVPDPNTGFSAETGWFTGKITLEKDSSKANSVNLVLPEGLSVSDDNIDWYVSGAKTDSHGKNFTLSGSLNKGYSYTVMATVKIDGILYDSGSISIIYQ